MLTKTRLFRLYSAGSKGVNVGAVAALFLAAMVCPAADTAGQQGQIACGNPRLVRLFTPLEPQLGRYEVCTASEPIDRLAPREWLRRQESPLDALGSAGTFNRSVVRRLYRASLATVARGWSKQGDGLVSITMISPYPDAALERLLPGTLVIRLIVDGGVRSAPATPADR